MPGTLVGVDTSTTPGVGGRKLWAGVGTSSTPDAVGNGGAMKIDRLDGHRFPPRSVFAVRFFPDTTVSPGCRWLPPAVWKKTLNPSPPLATLPPRPFGFRDVIDRCKNYARIKGCWPRLFIGGRIFATNARIASWIISGLIV
jgi:hypothetical protein